jgi:hypothetical protein
MRQPEQRKAVRMMVHCEGRGRSANVYAVVMLGDAQSLGGGQTQGARRSQWKTGFVNRAFASGREPSFTVEAVCA